MSALANVVSIEQKRAEYMGKPQVEDGYLRIANELFDAILNFRFSGRQLGVLFAIIRKTYGYNKKEDDISASQIAAMCALNRSHVCEAINQLVAMKVINKRPGSHGSLLSVQKNYLEWVKVEKEEGEAKQPVRRVAENHYTYMVTLPETGQFYIGVRSCKCHPNQDRYVGSGNWISTVKKADLQKTIIKTFANREEAEKHEAELIRQHAENRLMQNRCLYSSGTYPDPVQGVQKTDSAVPDLVQVDGTETGHTKDNVPKDKTKDKAQALLPTPDFGGIEIQQAWDEFIAHRVEIKKPLTERSAALNLNVLRKADAEGYCCVALIHKAIANSWRGIFEPKSGDKRKGEVVKPAVKSPFLGAV